LRIAVRPTPGFSWAAGDLMAAQEPELVVLGRTIRQIRQRRGMATSDLALAVDIPPERLEALEGGRYDPRYDLLVALASALGVGIAVLVASGEARGMLRHGERRLTPEEFRQHFGHLPTDGEG
jgi:transcriptional regulator with XRE-family HTH domain